MSKSGFLPDEFNPEKELSAGVFVGYAIEAGKRCGNSPAAVANPLDVANIPGRAAW